MSDLLLISLTGVLFLTGISLLKAIGRLALSNGLIAYQLTFPRNLDGDAVISAMAGISGLLVPWWRRWLSSPFLSLEIHANITGIHHYLVVPEAWGQSATNILQASLPAVRFEQVDIPSIALRTAAEYRMSSHDRQLNIDAVGLSARLLANLQPLEDRENVVVQWLVTPHGPVQPPRIAKNKDDSIIPSLALGLTLDSESASAMRKKQAQPLLLATGRIGVRARTGWRELKVLRTVEAAWHETRAPGVHFRRRTMTNAWVARSMATRRVPFAAWPATVNSEELSGLIGWPIGQIAVPGLVLGGSRLIPPSPLVPMSGTVLADSNYPGIERPIAVDVQARLRHTEILGPTGTGKSTLMVSMVLSDLEAGRGVILLDPKGDLVETLLWRIPENRRHDVIVFDPADRDCPVGLNPLRAAHGVNSEVVVENLVGTFKNLYSHSWGPRLDDILRAAILTLADVEGATLCEVSLILNDPSYRRKIVGKLDDPVGLESFWGWYEALSDAERQTVIGPVLNKVRALTMRPTVRSIIGQSNPKLSIPEVMASGKVLLCSLAGGLLGDEAAALLGALIVAEVWHATTARAGHPEASRKPVMAYLDEFQHFIHLPTPMASMLTEARGLGLGLTLAHQHLDQLDGDVRSAVLANARSKVLFQLPSADARLMEREMGGVVTADDLQGLGAYEVVCQLFAAGTTQAPATGRTRPLPPPLSDARSLRASSRSTYGLPREEVERSMRDRQFRICAFICGQEEPTGEVVMSNASHSGRVESDATLHLMGVGDRAKSANDSLDRNTVQRVGPQAKRVYVTRATLQALSRKMSVRQWAILGDVSRLGVTSGGQLQRLHYGSSEASKRQARLDLAEMVRWQVLERLKRTIGGERAGSKGYVYSMGVAGQRLVNPGRNRYRPPWTPRASHLRHALTVSDIYVGLRNIEAGPDKALATFDTEPVCWRLFNGPGGGRATLKPDAFAVLHLGEFEDRYFLEIDCGTEAGPRIFEKAKTYVRYFKSGREQAQTEVFPYVLWVTADDRRAAFLVQTLASIEAEHWKLFMVTTSDRAAGLMAAGPDQTTNDKEVK